MDTNACEAASILFGLSRRWKARGAVGRSALLFASALGGDGFEMSFARVQTKSAGELEWRIWSKHFRGSRVGIQWHYLDRRLAGARFFSRAFTVSQKEQCKIPEEKVDC